MNTSTITPTSTQVAEDIAPDIHDRLAEVRDTAAWLSQQAFDLVDKLLWLARDMGVPDADVPEEAHNLSCAAEWADIEINDWVEGLLDQGAEPAAPRAASVAAE
jgi:hypothetical protein